MRKEDHESMVGIKSKESCSNYFTSYKILKPV